MHEMSAESDSWMELHGEARQELGGGEIGIELLGEGRQELQGQDTWMKLHGESRQELQAENSRHELAADQTRQELPAAGRDTALRQCRPAKWPVDGIRSTT